ncbi:protein ORF-J [Proboscivirus elephantidbeta4]|uniref:Protein ORF-J n=1 Tax=Elephant endotheliotropic herpesvirus 4 TaxID=548914 RepID=A0A0S1TKR2_9BETA|nr:protein ORF-J [Elephant endotheliotropic herpesvirus 4]ALM25995.1 protein ORF-J [Elephant endotheliotropic herpesvirus 4]
MIRAKHLIAYLLGIEGGGGSGGKAQLRDEEYIDVSAATKSVLPDDLVWSQCPYISKTKRGDHGLPPLDLQCKPHDGNCFCAHPKSIFVPLESPDLRTIKGKRDKKTEKNGGKGGQTVESCDRTNNKKEVTAQQPSSEKSGNGGCPPPPVPAGQQPPLPPSWFLNAYLPPPEVLRSSVNPGSCYTPVKVIIGLIILACIAIAALTVLKQYCANVRFV